MTEFTGEVHPVAALFPMLADDELQELAADIKANGLLHPLVLDREGRLLDGRNRLAACEVAGIDPEFVVLDNGTDPDAYALSVNIARRHLSKGQQAMVAAKSRLISKQSQRAVAGATGLNAGRIGQASVVLDHAPDLVDVVVSGAVSLDNAYDTARKRKEAAESSEAKLEALRQAHTDLADQVVEERLTLAEAIAAAEAREAQRESERRAAATNLRSVLTYLVSETIEPADLAEQYANVIDEFDTSSLDYAASTMTEIAQLKRNT